MKVRNLKAWKTTTIGIIILIASILSIFFAGLNWTEAGIGIGIGTLFLFAPDTIIDTLTKFINK
jgi:hypothetical protein